MKISLSDLAVLLVAAALGCGGSQRPAPAAEPHMSFRSIGQSRIPVPVPPEGARLEGTHTTYHAGGKPKSHGSYAIHQGRSVPHGVWTFWLADGSRQIQGRFHLGDPVGCFASWSPAGARVTGFASKGEIERATCEPPRHQAADVLEASHGGEAQPRADFSFQTFVAPGASLGAETTKYESRDPDMTGSFAILWRRRLGDLRLGGGGGIRSAEYGYFGSAWTVLAGWGTRPTGWLAVDVWGELGALLLFARPETTDFREGREFFWTPLSAVQAETSWRVVGDLELTAAGRFEARMPREVERTTVFCDLWPCMSETDTWSLGGFALGAVLGVRFVIW